MGDRTPWYCIALVLLISICGLLLHSLIGSWMLIALPAICAIAWRVGEQI